jgi:hypothetical protein
MKEYRESLPKDSKTKSTSPKIVNRLTQILSTVGPDDGCSNGGCKCFGGACGTLKENKGCTCATSVPPGKTFTPVNICWLKTC